MSGGVKFALMARGSALQGTEEAGKGLEQIWMLNSSFNSFLVPETSQGSVFLCLAWGEEREGHPKGPQEGAPHPTSSLPSWPCSHRLPPQSSGKPVSALP